MNRILFAGDISWDMAFITPHVPGPDEKIHVNDYVEGLGGVACNTAAAAAKAGADVMFFGACGTDILSRAATDALEACGVNSCLASHMGSICRVVTMIEAHGEKRLLLYPGVSLYPAEADLALIDWTGVDHVHTAIYGPAGRGLIAQARQRGATWSLDLEPSTYNNGPADLDYAIDGATTLFVNDRAAAVIGGDAAGTLLSMGARSVVRTCGAAGATWTDGQDTYRTACPEGCAIVDTTGAGDCLAGWFLAGMTRHGNPEIALKYAVLAATLSCSAFGAQAGCPTQQDLEEKKGIFQS